MFQSELAKLGWFQCSDQLIEVNLARAGSLSKAADWKDPSASWADVEWWSVDPWWFRSVVSPGLTWVYPSEDLQGTQMHHIIKLNNIVQIRNKSSKSDRTRTPTSELIWNLSVIYFGLSLLNENLFNLVLQLSELFNARLSGDTWPHHTRDSIVEQFLPVRPLSWRLVFDEVIKTNDSMSQFCSASVIWQRLKTWPRIKA